MARMIDPALPWGVWLRMENDRAGNPLYVDDATGATYPSVRAAFWVGRLGMPERNGHAPDDALETIHAVLATAARRQPGRFEQVDDVHDGSDRFRTFHLAWLAGVGLIEQGGGGHGATDLTDEGWAVLAMLAATRPYTVRQHRPSSATVAMLVELGLGPEDREERFVRLERTAAAWDAAFLRRDEAGRPAIVLSHRGDGPMPVLRVVWTLRFATAEQRDRVYAWLATRLDRWRDWGAFASEYGARELTHHLLIVMAGSLADGVPIPVQPVAPLAVADR